MQTREGCASLLAAQRQSRREFLRAGGLGLLGFNLPAIIEAQELSSSRSIPASTFGRAKACILLFMWGGPAQQETWDLKPDAPEIVRGEFRPIATNVPASPSPSTFPGWPARPTGWRSSARCTTPTSTTRPRRTTC